MVVVDAVFDLAVNRAVRLGIDHELAVFLFAEHDRNVHRRKVLEFHGADQRKSAGDAERHLECSGTLKATEFAVCAQREFFGHRGGAEPEGERRIFFADRVVRRRYKIHFNHRRFAADHRNRRRKRLGQFPAVRHVNVYHAVQIALRTRLDDRRKAIVAVQRTNLEFCLGQRNPETGALRRAAVNRDSGKEHAFRRFWNPFVANGGGQHLLFQVERLGQHHPEASGKFRARRHIRGNRIQRLDGKIILHLFIRRQ